MQDCSTFLQIGSHMQYILGISIILLYTYTGIYLGISNDKW